MGSRQAQGFKKIECVRNAPFGREVETNNGWLFSAFENGVLKMMNIDTKMEIKLALEDYNAKEIKKLIEPLIEKIGLGEKERENQDKQIHQLK